MSHQMENMSINIDKSHKIKILNNMTKKYKIIDVDYVVLCTGFKNHVPDFINGIADKIVLEDNKFVVNKDFSIKWKGDNDRKIYVQNNARSIMGIFDPNLSLMAWRSSKIVNSLMGEMIYKTEFNKSIINWG